MKNFFALALAAALCLAPLALQAQDEIQESAGSQLGKLQFNFMSGATIASHNAGINRNARPLGGAGFEAVSPVSRYNFALGFGMDLTYTDIAFLVNRGQRVVESPVIRVTIPIDESLVYHLKYALNSRLYWNAPTYVLPASLFALIGFQGRYVTARGYRNGTGLIPGYQVGLGSEIGILPDFPEIKLRFEYMFAQNFGQRERNTNGFDIRSHDFNFGVVYEFW